MAEITASLVKELREMTGSGMLDCKKALNETDGNLQEAVDWLRKKGLANAAKKAGRVASQGLVAALVDGNEGVLVEVNSETDFVARNDDFQNFVDEVTKAALANSGDYDATLAHKDGDKTIADKVTDLVAKIGEHLHFRRSAGVKVNEGVVVPYIHSAVADGKGKIGVLVALESTGDKDALKGLAKQIAMHIAAVAPISLNIEEVPAEILSREKDIIKEQALASGKPEAIIEKMIEGRLRRFYEESVLLEQVFVMDNEKKVKEVIANAAKDLGADIELTSFVRFNLGEGIEKEETDFAAEVAAQLAK